MRCAGSRKFCVANAPTLFFKCGLQGRDTSPKAVALCNNAGNMRCSALAHKSQLGFSLSRSTKRVVGVAPSSSELPLQCFLRIAVRALHLF